MHRENGASNTTALLVALGDAVLIGFSYGFALLLRFDLSLARIPEEYTSGWLACTPVIVVSAMVLMWRLGLYRSVWSFVSMSELARLVQAWVMETLALLAYGSFIAPPMPRSFWAIGTLLAFGATTALRFSWRFGNLVRSTLFGRAAAKTTRVMVIGAGDAGRELLREVMSTPDLAMQVACLIDDNPAKQGRLIEGIPVVGRRDAIAQAAKDYEVDLIFVAIPSASGADRREIIECCQATGKVVRVVPGIYQFLDGQLSVSKLRNVNIEDLLGRDPANVDPEGIRELVRNKVVLVTGGGGSIGSELCRQVAKQRPAQLVIFDIYENNAYAIQQELLRSHEELDLVVLIGSVRDTARVREVFLQYRPDVVFHAAAHKHVPLMEDSPREAIKNNVFGTIKCAHAAAECGTSRFVLISTDKAVNPTNVMGASKRLCEMAMQASARSAEAMGSRTVFSAVRFGNVLGSNGSVVPLFERQIAEGGPVTVTDPRITRYFMTIAEAVSLVLQAACYAKGGEIFVLDMGEPVRIDDMARKLIRLAGFEPDKDIAVEYTGLRPGEKLYEERLMDEEGLGETPNRMISVARPIDMDDELFAGQVDMLRTACANGTDSDIRSRIASVVPTYHPELGGTTPDQKEQA